MARTPARSLLLALLAALLVVPMACSGDDGTSSDTTLPASDGADDGATTTAADGGAVELPEDPCEPTTTAVESLGWTIGDTEVQQVSERLLQCTWDANDGESFRNGYVLFIGSDIDLEFHEDEAVDGVGAEAYQGSPQTGEILVTGATPPFRLFVTGGSDNDADAVTLAKAVIEAS
jgi:hypothetical protein